MHGIAGALIILSHEIIPQIYLEIYMAQYNWVITRYVVSDTCLKIPHEKNGDDHK